MTWNNKKNSEIRDKKNQEASELYEKYEENKNYTSEKPQNSIENLEDIYNNYKAKPEEKEQESDDSNEKLKEIYSYYKEIYSDDKENKGNGSILKPYKIYIGDYRIPITPDNINFKNDTDPKIFKSIKGRDIIVGVNVLPREVRFASYFPYMIKDKVSSKSPKEYKDYFQDLKNKGEKVLLKIEGTGESFYAYVTKFDYDYIAGKDIDYSITLKEYSEESANDFEI